MVWRSTSIKVIKVIKTKYLVLDSASVVSVRKKVEKTRWRWSLVIAAPSSSLAPGLANLTP